MARAVSEWIGKSDDAKVPPRVRLRIFNRANGICHISGRKIMPGELWELEHIKALILGGEHRESNLAPALVKPHKDKTAEEMAIKAKTDAVRKKHVGITRPAGKLQSPGFAQSEKSAKRSQRPSLPPRQLFKEIAP